MECAASTVTAPLADDAELFERVLYLHTDRLGGTPRLATNGRGKVIWRWNGGAFGSVAPAGAIGRDDDTGEVTINLRFPGQYYDKETGFFYNGARYYAPALGRYITSDPVGLVGGLNSYGYVGQNPTGYVDPNGEDWRNKLLSGCFLLSILCGKPDTGPPPPPPLVQPSQPTSQPINPPSGNGTSGSAPPDTAPPDTVPEGGSGVPGEGTCDFPDVFFEP